MTSDDAPPGRVGPGTWTIRGRLRLGGRARCTTPVSSPSCWTPSPRTIVLDPLSRTERVLSAEPPSEVTDRTRSAAALHVALRLHVCAACGKGRPPTAYQDLAAYSARQRRTERDRLGSFEPHAPSGGWSVYGRTTRATAAGGRRSDRTSGRRAAERPGGHAGSARGCSRTCQAARHRALLGLHPRDRAGGGEAGRRKPTETPFRSSARRGADPPRHRQGRARTPTSPAPQRITGSAHAGATATPPDQGRCGKVIRPVASTG